MSHSAQSSDELLLRIDELFSTENGAQKNRIVYDLIDVQLASNEQVLVVREAINRKSKEHWPQLDEWLVKQENDLFSLGGNRPVDSTNIPKEASGFWARNFSPSCPNCKWTFSFTSVPRNRRESITCPRCAARLTLDGLTRFVCRFAQLALIPTALYSASKDVPLQYIAIFAVIMFVMTLIGYKLERLVLVEKPESSED